MKYNGDSKDLQREVEGIHFNLIDILTFKTKELWQSMSIKEERV